MQHTARSRRRRDDRGLSVSLFVASLIPLFLLLCGLVVDGGAKASAQRHAEVAAAQAARDGSDASAADRLAGGSGAAAAVAAANDSLAAHGAQGSASVRGGVLTVHVTGHADTLFLTLIGIDRFTVQADATSALVRA